MNETTKEVNAVALFREYLRAWSSHDVDGILSFFAEECSYENLARQEAYRGKVALRAWIDGMFAAIPDFSLEARSLFASGGWVACEWAMTGTHSGDAPGLPATGNRFSVRGSTIAEVAGAKIKRNADYWDLTTFLQQLGVLAK